MPQATLKMRHGVLWMSDPCYRLGWLLGPQCVAISLAIGLFASPAPLPSTAPPPPPAQAQWMRPSHTGDNWASLKQLRDQALSDPGARAQLDHQALSGVGLAQFFKATLHDPNLHFHPNNPAEPMKAMRFYRLAADQGIDVARTNLGIILLNEQNTGVVQDFEEARRLFEQAAQTSPAGTRELGIMKKNGWGEPEDRKGGMRMIQTAAERGDVIAERIMGFAHENGENGIVHDPHEAVAWLQKAAEFGDPPAQRQLGMHLKTGDGISTNPAAALEWFKRAAANGDAAAQSEVDAAAAHGPS